MLKVYDYFYAQKLKKEELKAGDIVVWYGKKVRKMKKNDKNRIVGVVVGKKGNKMKVATQLEYIHPSCEDWHLAL